MTGDITDIETADQWEARGRTKLNTAKHLLQISNMEEAFHVAGVAVECELKARIMRFERLNRWPEMSSRRDLYTHDLTSLLVKAGLEAAMDSQIDNATSLASAWLVVRNWTIGSRYVSKVRVSLARDMVKAAEEFIKWKP
jgi:HEPN domain-containing protein